LLVVWIKVSSLLLLEEGLVLLTIVDSSVACMGEHL
jgi:hypothetical protein